MIPKIIHQIWIGPDLMPPQCEGYQASWKKHNPDFQHLLWTNANLPQLSGKCQAQFDRYGARGKWAFQADILRYFLIHKYGGIYADIDFECFRPVAALCDSDFFLVPPDRHKHWFCNGLFGSVAGHPFLERILGGLKNENYHGPIFLTDELRKFYGLPLDHGIAAAVLAEELAAKGVRCIDPEHFFSQDKNGHSYARHWALKSWRRDYDD